MRRSVRVRWYDGVLIVRICVVCFMYKKESTRWWPTRCMVKDRSLIPYYTPHPLFFLQFSQRLAHLPPTTSLSIAVVHSHSYLFHYRSLIFSLRREEWWTVHNACRKRGHSRWDITADPPLYFQAAEQEKPPKPARRIPEGIVKLALHYLPLYSSYYSISTRSSPSFNSNNTFIFIASTRLLENNNHNNSDSNREE